MMERFRPSYDIEDHGKFNGMVVDESGKWVTYDDAQAALAAKDAEDLGQD